MNINININISLLINMKMSITGGIFIYICRKKSRVELEKNNNAMGQHCRTDIELTLLTFSPMGF